jgi:hypothetical protein
MVAAWQGLPDFCGGFGELVEFTHVRGPGKTCQRESLQKLYMMQRGICKRSVRLVSTVV